MTPEELREAQIFAMTELILAVAMHRKLSAHLDQHQHPLGDALRFGIKPSGDHETAIQGARNCVPLAGREEFEQQAPELRKRLSWRINYPEEQQ